MGGVIFPGPRIVPLFGVVLRPIQAFFRLEAASGIVLLACAVGALAWVNLGGAGAYAAVLGTPIQIALGGAVARFTLLQVVNDGLMTIFFFLVGMEIKRELALGELRAPSAAALPAIAALGGMLVPAGVYFALNHAGPGRHGWGIPMATDIAFSIGVLTLLRSRVSHGHVVFLTALAIFDDIGGILVIALFYGTGLHAGWLAAAAAVAIVTVAMSRADVRRGPPWAVALAALWWMLHHAGIHATIAGVVIGLAVPARPRRPLRPALLELAEHARAFHERPADDELDSASVLRIEETLEDIEAPLTRFEELLHPWVAFGVMPLFALANSGVDLRGIGAEALLGPVAVGTAAGLVLGKMAGVFGFTLAAVRLRLAPMPGASSRPKLLGVSIVAGIGFTVALFIATLAFPGAPLLLDQAKVGILAGSLASGVTGALLLRFTAPVRAAAAAAVDSRTERALS
jgi:Na+:H+ antiporter, NhaA family